MELIFRKIIGFFPSKPEKSLIGSIKLNLSIGRFFGIPFTLPNDSSKHSLKLIFHTYCFVSLILSYLYTIFEVADMIASRHDLNALSQNVCLTISHLAAVFKAFNAIYFMEDITHSIRSVEKMVKRYILSKRQRQAFISLEKVNVRVLSLYVSIVSLTAFVGVIALVLNENFAGNYFPYRAQLPIILPRIVRVTYHAVGILYLALQAVVCDLLNINLINQVQCQLKVLKYTLDEMKLESYSNPVQTLHKCIQHHQNILKARNRIEKAFKYPILIQFFTSLLIWAMTGFQATVQSEISARSILLYLYCCCIFVELFLYCWFANQMMEQNKTLAIRGYSTAWYTFGTAYSKKLLIFLINAQQPLAFTGGGFFYLSLNTFTGILSRSYSYIALLQQFYSES